MNQEVKGGRVPSEPGSRPTDQARSGHGASRFDPSRSRKGVGGRPRHNPLTTKTGTLNVRVDPLLKEQIAAAAEANGTSFSGEIERRLLSTFPDIGAEQQLAALVRDEGRLLVRLKQVRDAQEILQTGLGLQARSLAILRSHARDRDMSAAMDAAISAHRDSDGSGEAVETALAGSTEGDSAGRQASPTSHPGERA